MAFRLKACEPVQKALRRLTARRIDKATAGLTPQAADLHERIHDARTRCKQIRALLRLVRPCFAGYDAENAAVRDAAGLLSDVRDAQALRETYDRLVARCGPELDRTAVAPVRRRLTDRLTRLSEEANDLDQRLAEFLARMKDVRERSRSWQLSRTGFAAIAGGLGKTYGRGRRAMTVAYEDATAENFHDWRKRVKYHWYHLRLLHPMWKPVLGSRIDAIKLLSDLLGEDHDLSVFRQALVDDVGGFGERRVEMLLGTIARRQVELRRDARWLGLRVYAEKPRDLVRRIGRYWAAWQDEHSRPGQDGGGIREHPAASP